MQPHNTAEVVNRFVEALAKSPGVAPLPGDEQ